MTALTEYVSIKRYYLWHLRKCEKMSLHKEFIQVDFAYRFAKNLTNEFSCTGGSD
jgi:hypothetical protein